MKKVMFVFLTLFVFGISASVYAQGKGCQQEQMGQGMSNDQGQMSKMQCPKMQQMSGQGMMQGGHQMQMMHQMMGPCMMHDMLNMMIDIQEKMLKGVKAAEKKKMMQDITKMREKMQNMMDICKFMMMSGMGQLSGDSQYRMNCAEQWLKKAIDLHEVHIKDPKTATESSQMEMMEQMKKAYDCITGKAAEMRGAPSKNLGNKGTEEKKAPKDDPHGH